MQIKNIKLKLGDRIRLTWSNQAPIRVDEGKLIAYEKTGGVSRVRVLFADGVESCWFNAKHPACAIELVKTKWQLKVEQRAAEILKHMTPFTTPIYLKTPATVQEAAR